MRFVQDVAAVTHMSSQTGKKVEVSRRNTFGDGTDTKAKLV